MKDDKSANDGIENEDNMELDEPMQDELERDDSIIISNLSK